jgi:hypothetical protein
MGEKQLNVWIDSHLKDALAERAKREKRSLTDLTEAILQQDMARKNGEVVEQQALPILREIVAIEVRKGMTQLLNDLRDEIHLDLMDEIKTVIHHSDDRLAKLIARAVRDTGMSRRLAIAHLSKAYGPDFARSAYEGAMEDVGKELAGKGASRPEKLEIRTEQGVRNS